jgi:SulP family sulfate permease
VLVPIAVALIVTNGLSPTAVLLPAGLLYVVAAFAYRLPVPVQPLKALGAIAIAKGLGVDEIAAAALLIGSLFLVVGRLGVIDRVSRAFPRPLIRGVQLAVGLLFLKIAWGLMTDPPNAFVENASAPWIAVLLGAAVMTVALVLWRTPITLALVALGVVVMVVQADGAISYGPSSLQAPSLDWATLWAAFTLLVIPQVPLSFANSCLATADASRVYFGQKARTVTAGRLATSLGAANLFSGAISGMPVCHGAGGLTAHYAFGARTGRAPLALGSVLIALALAVGGGLAVLLVGFPLPILAGLLATAGLLHIGLLWDLTGRREWSIALLVGTLGFLWNLAFGLAIGLILWWLPVLVRGHRKALLARG